MVSTSSIMEQVTLICPLVSAWSGTAKIRRDSDLAAIKGQMPPKELVSDGAKHIVKSEAISKLVSVRKAVQRELEKLGTPMCGGFLIPDKNVPKAMVMVAAKETEFDKELDALVTSLPDLYEAQEKRFPAWAEFLRPHQISGQEVRNRCSFRVAAFKLNEPHASAAATAFHDAEGCVVNSLLDSVAREADRIRKASFIGVSQIGQRPMNAIRELVGKLESFSFVDSRVYPTCQVLHSLLSNLPKKGQLSVNETAALDGMLAKLADPETVLVHGQSVLASQNQQAPLLPAVIQAADSAAAIADEEEATIEAPLSHIAQPTPAQAGWTQNLVF